MDFVTILVGRTNERLTGLVRILPQLGIALFVVLVTWCAAKVVRRAVHELLRRGDFRQILVRLFETLAGVALWVVGVIIASSINFPGITPASLLAVLGLESVAVGFAFKDIFENFYAGILIMLRKRMNIGDVIECEADRPPRSGPC